MLLVSIPFSFPTFLSILSTILLLSLAPTVEAAAVSWFDFFHRPGADSIPWLPPAAPTPRPDATDIAAPAVTSAPEMPEVELMLRKRAGTNTCGYLEGNSEAPFVCGGTGSCVSYAPSSAIGCCRSSSCSVVTSCIDYTNFQRGACKTMRSGTGCCDNALRPYCKTLSFLDISMKMMQCADTTSIGYVEMMFSPTPEPNTMKKPAATNAFLSNDAPAVVTTTSTGGPGGQTAAPVAEVGGGGGGGLSSSDKIALGCGIGIGLPAALAGIYTAWRARRRF